MLCPFDLEDVTFDRQKAQNRPGEVFICPVNKEEVPAQYVRDYRQYPPVVVSAVGFRGHGKTVYFASLFHVLKKSDLPSRWPGFFTQGLDEEDLNTIYSNMRLLESGMLPDSTPKNFPRPTMIRVTGIPNQRNCTWLCFDTGGECFEKPRQLVQYASFVRRANSVLLLISPLDLEDPAVAMGKLLNAYVSGLRELGGNTRNQHLIVVYTKADQLGDFFGEQWSDLPEYVASGTVDGMADFSGYLLRMHRISERLEAFTSKSLKAYEFLNAARGSFRSVAFCVVSALGAKPSGKNLEVCIAPKRILDPMLWIMEKSQLQLRFWWLPSGWYNVIMSATCGRWDLNLTPIRKLLWRRHAS